METETYTSLPNNVYREAVDKIAKLHNLDNESKYEIDISAGSAKGDNYFGAIYRIKIKSKEDGSVKLSILGKFSPKNEAKRDELMADVTCLKEIHFYDTLMPLIKSFQEEKGVKVDVDGFNEAPDVYLTLNQAPNEGIFFEDLKERNFSLFDRQKDITKEHVMLVLKALAKMHAVFFCIKDQQPELVKSIVGIEDFYLVLIRNGKTFISSWFEGQKNLAFKALQKVEDLEMKNKVDKFLKRDFEEMLSEYIETNIAEPYSTLCHGDIWNNNMMFRNNENGTPVEVKLFDYQVVRYSSPVIDVVHYIFGSTTKELRDQHYQEFLDTYYNTLSDLIKRLNSDPEKLYPREVFEKHLLRFGGFGLFMGVMALPGITTNVEDTPDPDDIAEGQKSENGENATVNFTYNDRYVKMMTGVFEDIINLGYI